MTSPRDLLAVLRGDGTAEDAPEAPEAPQAATEDPRPPAPLILRGGKMTPQQQVWAAFSHAVLAARHHARAQSRREGGLVNGLMNGKPPSFREQSEYAASRAWVPPGHEGGLAERAGVLYHAVIGKPGVALGNTISAVFARPLRLAIAAFLLGTFMLFVFIWLG